MTFGRVPNLQEFQWGGWEYTYVVGSGGRNIWQTDKIFCPRTSTDQCNSLITQKRLGIKIHVRKWQQGTEKEA